jgi:hypothetical protein
VLDDCLACLVECARVLWAGPALQVGSRVLEGVDRTLGGEACEVAATEFACVAGTTHVLSMIVPETADKVAGVCNPLQHEVVSVEHEQLVCRAPVIGKVAGL